MKTFQSNGVEKMKDWLISVFSNIEFVNGIFLIGSVLHKNHKEINDVDIVQQICFENNSKLIAYVQTINKIRDNFAKEFLCSLHVTTFTQNEMEDFHRFMSKNFSIKLI